MHARSTGTVPLLIASLLIASLLNGSLSAQEADRIRAQGADIEILPLEHGTVGIVHGPHVILIDPARFIPMHPPAPKAELEEMLRAYIAKNGPLRRSTSPDEWPVAELLPSAVPVRPEQMARFQGLKPPTLILVTHSHVDHLDPRAIAALRSPETRIIVPKSARKRLLDVQGAETMANGDRLVVGDITVEAIPMYNTEPFPDSRLSRLLHQKGRGNGYVLGVGGARIYVAGDTGCTPEMKRLKNIDVAFVPMNLPHTMSPTQAAECVKVMKPKIVYPYHYFQSDPAAFESALKGSGIEVRFRDWYVPVNASAR